MVFKHQKTPPKISKSDGTMFTFNFCSKAGYAFTKKDFRIFNPYSFFFVLLSIDSVLSSQHVARVFPPSPLPTFSLDLSVSFQPNESMSIVFRKIQRLRLRKADYRANG